MANRLAQETSPYLLQHKNNPVDWYPWGQEAIDRARNEDKPILLSIGYSACHWCHVMEKESFENPEIAQLMNRHFINIKVDREERPDLDHIYQNVAQVMTRGGGWPLTVFLTPALKPFYGGTYFPPEERYGRPGFKKVLESLSHAYRTDPFVVGKNALKLSEIVAAFESVSAEKGPGPSLESLQKAAEEILRGIDWEMGGFEGAPKFPNPMVFTFLWRYGRAKGDEKAQKAVLLSLTQMASRGIYDQLGGGFHRYSVDASWSVPHFEKMLYDNALLLKLYSEVLLTDLESGGVLNPDERNLYLKVLKETTEYLYREMLSPDGAFYTAQDADSEGEEGKYFVWDLNDLSLVLTPEEARAIAIRLGVSESGNFEHQKTVLYAAQSIQEVAEKMKWTLENTTKTLESASQKLLKARQKRIPPGLDNKVLVSWNGLLISGLTWTAQAMQKSGLSEEGEKAYSHAEKAYYFLKNQVCGEKHRLYSTFQGGKPRGNAFLDDYAFMAFAALDLSRFAKEDSQIENYLEDSYQWIQIILKHFKGEKDAAGYYFTSDDHEELLQRPKTIFDQAIPSGTAVVLTCLLALAELDYKGEGKKFEDELEKQFSLLSRLALENPHGMGETLCASLLNVAGVITIAGPDSKELCHHPHIFRKPELPESDEAFLVCHRKTCGLPFKQKKEAKEEISKIQLQLLKQGQ